MQKVTAAVAVVTLLFCMANAYHWWTTMAGHDDPAKQQKAAGNATAIQRGDALMRVVAVLVVVKRDAAHGYLVRTQTRKVVNKAYDPMYGGTLEALGETVQTG